MLTWPDCLASETDEIGCIHGGMAIDWSCFSRIFAARCLVVGIRHSHCHGPGSFPGQGSLSSRTSLVAQMVKRLSTMWETQVQSLGQEDLEKSMATHSSILPGKSHGQRSLGRLQSMESWT